MEFVSTQTAVFEVSWNQLFGEDAMNEFEIQVLSDKDYEDLIAEVLYGEEFFLLIDQEEGFGNFKLSIYPRDNGKPWNIKLSELDQVLKKTINRLRELQKNS